MIARTWRGSTVADNAENYVNYLKATGFPGYAGVPGNRGVVGLRWLRDGRADFLLLTLWDSDQAVRAFAGKRPDQAVFYPEDGKYLVARDETVDHYQVIFERLPKRRSLLARLIGGWWRAWQLTGTPDHERMSLKVQQAK